jgi:trehalose/maltose transport system permease protein
MAAGTGPFVAAELAGTEAAPGRGRGLAAERARLAWWLLAPAIIVVVLVALVPLAQTIGYSFTDARLGSTRPIRWVGLRHYVELLADRRFLNALAVTVQFTVVTVAIETGLGLAIALVLDARFRARGLVRAAILIPWAIPTVMATQMWKWMFHDVFGVVNDLGIRAGLLHEPVAWLADRAWIFAAVCAVDVWKTTPFMALLLLAGLQLVPRELYDAADLDGASPLARLWYVTLPLLRPTLLVALIFRTLDALRAFDVFYVMVGNRPGFQTLAVFNQQVLVEFSRVGQGSAVSVLIFAVIAAFVAAYMWALAPREAR